MLAEDPDHTLANLREKLVPCRNDNPRTSKNLRKTQGDLDFYFEVQGSIPLSYQTVFIGFEVLTQIAIECTCFDATRTRYRSPAINRNWLK